MPAFYAFVYCSLKSGIDARTTFPPSDAEKADGKTRFEFSNWPNDPLLQVRHRSFSLLYPRFVVAPVASYAIGEATTHLDRSFMTHPNFQAHVEATEAAGALKMFLEDKNGWGYFLVGAGILRRRIQDGIILVEHECYPILAPTPENAFHTFVDLQSKPGFSFLGAHMKARRYERSELSLLQAGFRRASLRPIFIENNQIQRTFH